MVSFAVFPLTASFAADARPRGCAGRVACRLAGRCGGAGRAGCGGQHRCRSEPDEIASRAVVLFVHGCRSFPRRGDFQSPCRAGDCRSPLRCRRLQIAATATPNRHYGAGLHIGTTVPAITNRRYSHSKSALPCRVAYRHYDAGDYKSPLQRFQIGTMVPAKALSTTTKRGIRGQAHILGYVAKDGMPFHPSLPSIYACPSVCPLLTATLTRGATDCCRWAATSPARGRSPSPRRPPSVVLCRRADAT